MKNVSGRLIFVFNFKFGRSFLIEEKCRFLSNFSLQTAEVELPGEFLLPKVMLKVCVICETTPCWPLCC